MDGERLPSLGEGDEAWGSFVVVWWFVLYLHRNPHSLLVQAAVVVCAAWATGLSFRMSVCGSSEDGDKMVLSVTMSFVVLLVWWFVLLSHH